MSTANASRTQICLINEDILQYFSYISSLVARPMALLYYIYYVSYPQNQKAVIILF